MCVCVSIEKNAYIRSHFQPIHILAEQSLEFIKTRQVASKAFDYLGIEWMDANISIDKLVGLFLGKKIQYNSIPTFRIGTIWLSWANVPASEHRK